jgi:hypothetical protein
MIVPDSIVATVRSLADSFGPAASGMWATGLSPTGAEPATHWISTGLIGDDFAKIMPYSHDVDGEWVTEPYDPAAFVALADVSGATPPPVEAIAHIMSQVDVSDQEPLAAMERLGLYMITNAETQQEV